MLVRQHWTSFRGHDRLQRATAMSSLCLFLARNHTLDEDLTSKDPSLLAPGVAAGVEHHVATKASSENAALRSSVATEPPSSPSALDFSPFAMDQSSPLLKIMANKADVVLLFNSEDGKHTSPVPAHSSILSLHSSVLENALDSKLNSATVQAGSNTMQLARVSNSSGGTVCTVATLTGNRIINSSSIKGFKKLAISGTSKEDFLTVAAFLYPITPLPKATWENLEVLLVEGRKWDMKVVLAHAAEFIRANVGSMTVDPASPYYTFKWLQLADAASLSNESQLCVDKIADLDPRVFDAPHAVAFLADISQQTLVYAVRRLARGYRSFGGLGQQLGQLADQGFDVLSSSYCPTDVITASCVHKQDVEQPQQQQEQQCALEQECKERQQQPQ